MSVEPACRSSPVWGLCRCCGVGAYGWRGSLLVVLVPTRCCSIVLEPAHLKGYCVSSSQRSAGVSEAQTTTAALLSSSLTCPVSVGRRVLCGQLGAERERTATLADDISSPSRSSYCSGCLSSLHEHFMDPSGSRIGIAWHVRRSFQLHCTPWDFMSVQFWYASWHSVGSATMGLSGIFLELVATVVPALAVQATLPYGTIRGYVLDVDLANVLGVVVVKLKQGLLVLTCWSYSRYFFTLLLRCMGVTCGTRTFSLSLRWSDGSEGGGEFASMIRSRRLGGLSSSGLAVLGSRSLRSCGLICYVSFFQ